MKTTVQPTLRTERLVLRPFDLTDAAEAQRLAKDKAIADTTLPRGFVVDGHDVTLFGTCPDCAEQQIA